MKYLERIKRAMPKRLGVNLKKLRGDEAGQTSTEYMLIIAVVVLGAVAAASVLLPQFKGATNAVAGTLSKTMTDSATASQGAVADCVGGQDSC